MPPATPNSVRHDTAAKRLVLDIDGELAVLEYRELNATTLDYHRTYVPPALRGRGMASIVTEHALRYARDHGYRVVPSCPFVARFIERHPDYQPLRA
jgi:predicted GNAT family acetyltransferase